jgi:uncharacterized protein (UPF0332 family)
LPKYSKQNRKIEIGDYEVSIEIEEDTARERVEEAEKFVNRIEQYLQGKK